MAPGEKRTHMRTGGAFRVITDKFSAWNSSMISRARVHAGARKGAADQGRAKAARSDRGIPRWREPRPGAMELACHVAWHLSRHLRKMMPELKKVLATWAFLALLSATLLFWTWPSPGWEHFLFVSVATLLLTLFCCLAAMGINFFFGRLKKLAKR